MPGNGGKKRKSAGTRKGLKSTFPLTIRQGASIDQHLIDVPYKHILDIVEGNGCGVNFHSILFRLMAGDMFASSFKEEEISEAFKEVFVATQQMEDRFKETNQWTVTPEENNAIHVALAYTDEMQRATTRREHLDVQLAVKAKMKPYVHYLSQKEPNNELRN